MDFKNFFSKLFKNIFKKDTASEPESQDGLDKDLSFSEANKEEKPKRKNKKERLAEKIAAMSENEKTAYLKKRKIKKIILFSALGLVVAGISICSIYVYNIINNPAGFFKKDASASPATTQIQLDGQYDYMLSIADKEIMKDTINVLLIGVDYAQERATWDKYFYSDVMMVLAINFKENRVDMISVPRDTYAKLSVIKDDRTTEKPETGSIYLREIGKDGGIFKLNSSIYNGGGIPSGFQNVCDSVSWELGGIPIDFYMGVTMPVVKELVNLIGGVDYNVDLDYTIQGRSYKIGMQHLDGQGVLDYLRVRKNVTSSGDLNRVNRQKKMLVAVFDKLKTTNLIFSVPEIIRALNGQLYTDMSFEQVASLAVFGSKLEDENISMYTMGGTQKNIFNWLYVITDQEKRVDIIKKVYKITVPKYTKYSLQYCGWLWATMQGEKYIDIVNGILDKDAALAEADRKIPIETIDNLKKQIDDLTALMNMQNVLPDKERDGTQIDAAIQVLKDSATSMFSAAGYNNISWFVNENPGRKRLTG